MIRRSLITLVIFLSIASGAKAADSRQIQSAIDRAKAFLYSQQNNLGTWESSPAPQADKQAWEPTGGQWGGVTALATYSLLASGDRPRDPRLSRTIEFLKSADIRGVYALAMRAQVWGYLPADASTHLAIERDGKLLLNAMQSTGQATGMYGYLTPAAADDPNHAFDHSVSQYGVLGIWALEEAGLEVPDKFWSIADAAWRRQQLADGGWSYYSQPQAAYPETVTLTAAGVASLFLSDDYLRAASGLECHDTLVDADIGRGIAWIGGHFDSLFDSPNRACYALYGIERIGAASGRRMLGQADWYARGADFLLSHQMQSGAWDQGNGPIADTALGLLFLIRGRAPVVMNKLVDGPDANHRPRDLAHLSRWISRMIEANRPLNWQVVDFSGDGQDWHDSPILYICGHQARQFSGDEQSRLKRFVEEGGLIVCNADCSDSAPFVQSIKELGIALFNREFRPLPADHPIYVNEEFHRDRWKNPPLVLGLSNGVRELMILIPTADLSAAWQVNDPLVRPEAFGLGADIFLYAVDKQNLRNRGDSYLVATDPAVPTQRQIKLARLDYGDNFDPEPGGWRRMAAILHNHDGVDLSVTPVKLGDGSLLHGGYLIAHLTGTGALSLPAIAEQEIQHFVQSGGTLIVDAAGGNMAFAQSARRELGICFPDKAAQLDKPLPLNDPIYSAGQPRLYGRDIAFRPYALTDLGNLKLPRLSGIDFGNRVGVYFSRQDLSVGLVGEPVDGIIGYTPELATMLMEKMILAARRAD